MNRKLPTSVSHPGKLCRLRPPRQVAYKMLEGQQAGRLQSTLWENGGEADGPTRGSGGYGVRNSFGQDDSDDVGSAPMSSPLLISTYRI